MLASPLNKIYLLCGSAGGSKKIGGLRQALNVSCHSFFKMKLPFSIDKYYTTHLSKSQVAEELNNLVTEKKFGGLRRDKLVTQISESGFIIGRNSYGVDGFTLEQYPAVEGIYFSERPLTINIQIKPSYFNIIFFSIFVVTFIPASVFIDNMTITAYLDLQQLWKGFFLPLLVESYLDYGVTSVTLDR